MQGSHRFLAFGRFLSYVVFRGFKKESGIFFPRTIGRDYLQDLSKISERTYKEMPSQIGLFGELEEVQRMD